MKNKQALSIRQNQKLIMNLAMQQAVQVLQMPLEELVPWIESEVMQNPLLEFTTPNLHACDFVEHEGSESLLSFLQKEARLLFSSKADQQIAEILCGFLDDKGFLTASFDEIAAFCGQPKTKIKQIAHQLSQIDPPGLVTLDLRHSLLAQLEKAGKINSLAHQIVQNYWEAFKKLRFDLIANKLKIPRSELDFILHKDIRPLDPSPASVFATQTNRCITPDFTIIEENGLLTLHFPSDAVPEFKIQEAYLDSIEDESFKRRWLASAKWLKRMVYRRQTTLAQIGLFLIEHQSAFFLGLKDAPKPMTASSIAKDLNLNVSTITRALNHKHIDTPKGFFPLTFFIATTQYHKEEIKQALLGLIKGENTQKPYSDQILAHMLSEKGIKISRRTVAKYRVALAIPSACARKKSIS